MWTRLTLEALPSLQAPSQIVHGKTGIHSCLPGILLTEWFRPSHRILIRLSLRKPRSHVRGDDRGARNGLDLI